MQNKWFDTFNDDAPDWGDVGKDVQMVLESGETVEGELFADVAFSGEDEFPIFEVHLPDGTAHSFYSGKRWRYV